MAAVDQHRGVVGVKPLCDALGVSRETYYRRTRPRQAGPRRRRQRPNRALSDQERSAVLELLCSERFVDRSPTEAYGTLLDEGIYRCSLRTMYRVLKANHAVRERRDQLRHPEYKKPELIATAPNQVWSWDITKLLGPEKWSYFYLYVVLDIFSRYVVGWMLARTENAELAQ
jgi:putative transposase